MVAEPSEDGLLYHYTDVNGLKGIIQSNRLWATASSHLNDLAEMRTLPELIEKTVVDSGHRIGDFDLKSISRRLTPFIYLFCLSSKGNLLSQWRGYCPKGGFSIGFQKDQLQDDLKSVSANLVECIYIDPSVVSSESEKIKSLVREINAPPREEEEPFDASIKELLNDQPTLPDETKMLISKLLLNASRYKHCCFIEELEWRIRK